MCVFEKAANDLNLITESVMVGNERFKIHKGILITIEEAEYLYNYLELHQGYR